ncbi:hypothetical protein QPK87_35885 [Kamptonema cortianum]|nr:hypothetical protein [Kamptonema cortianum]
MATKSSHQKNTPARKNSPGRLQNPMRGCDIVVAALEREDVDVIFAYPGGASMELHQGLTRSKKNSHGSPPP